MSLLEKLCKHTYTKASPSLYCEDTKIDFNAPSNKMRDSINVSPNCYDIDDSYWYPKYHQKTTTSCQRDGGILIAAKFSVFQARWATIPCHECQCMK